MSKFVLFIFAILIILLGIAITSTNAYALGKCFMGTDPTPLTNEVKKAKFTVNVANLGGSDTFTKWRIEFQCGFPKKIVDAQKDKPDNIFTEVDNGPLECVFSAGGHDPGVIVKGVRSDGEEVPQCEASYWVGDTKSLCKLSVSPETGITSNTSLTVSGTNLVKDGQFAVFVDNERITGNAVDPGFVNTPSFSGLSIPSKYLAVGAHKIDLRRWKVARLPIGIQPLPLPGGLPGIPVFQDIHKYADPLCLIGFTVGTPTNPGGVSGPGPAGIISWIPGIAAKAAPCNNDPKDPGIQTAIGCIHTNPASFIKDILGFVIGIAGGLAFLMMILGAFQMLTSAGNPDTLQAGRDRLQSAVIGLLFVIFAVLLLQIIGFDILKIPGFGR